MKHFPSSINMFSQIYLKTSKSYDRVAKSKYMAKKMTGNEVLSQ